MLAVFHLSPAQLPPVEPFFRLSKGIRRVDSWRAAALHPSVRPLTVTYGVLSG